MIIFKKASQLTSFLEQQKTEGKKTGFVPTMGALHEGHLTLIKTSKMQVGHTVASIFVNPTQFNNPNDFKLYPVTIEKDIKQLEAAGCDILFLPAVDEIYPPSYAKPHYDLGDIENRLEGFYRPGHFQGVCQVVDRLLQIVNPDHLYLGQKDFQQCMVIKKLLEITGRDKSIKLEIVPTQREADGLAMSSRNLRLNEDQRKKATVIYRELSRIKAGLQNQPFEELKQKATARLSHEGFNVDYVEIANRQDLSAATDPSQPLVVLAAASIGEIRLIDNLLLN
jgi:pantoate--beta-alanine ligase